MTAGAEVGASVVGEVGEAVVGAPEGAPVVGAAEGAEDGATEGALVVGAAVGVAVMSSYVDSHSQTHELTMLHLLPPACPQMVGRFNFCKIKMILHVSTVHAILSHN